MKLIKKNVKIKIHQGEGVFSLRSATDVMAKRIKEKRLELGLTQEELGKMIGTQRAAVNKYESGLVENMKRSTIKQLSLIFDVDPKWLMAFDIDDVSLVENHNSYKIFPVGISAGSLENIDGIDSYDMITIADEIMGKYAGRKGVIILKVNGDSMNRIIPDGAYIVVDTNKTTVTDISDRDIIVFANGGEGYYVKRYVNDTKNERFLFKPESTDDTFTAIEINYENSLDLKLIGKVVKYIVSLD